MKVLLSLLVFMFFMLYTKAQCDYQITGNMVGVSDGEVILSTWDGLQSVVVSKTKVNGGKFVFTGNTVEAVWAIIHTSQGVPLASFMLENAKYSVLSGGVVTGGGDAQALWVKFDAINFDLAQKRQKLEAEYMQAEQKRDKEQVRKIDVCFQSFLAEMQAREVALLKQYSDTRVAAFVVASTMRGLSLTQLQERFELLGKHARACSFGQAVTGRISKLENLEIDAIAPDFSLPSSDVGLVSLHETKARLKVVYFWASGDVASRERNVELLRLHEQFQPKGLEIITISLDENKQDWLRAIGEDGMNEWQNGCDLQGESSSVVQIYCVDNIPRMWLVDGDNRIVGKDLWGIDLRKRVAVLLKK